MAFTNYSSIGIGNMAPASSSYTKPKTTTSSPVYGPPIPVGVSGSKVSGPAAPATLSASTSRNTGSSSSSKSSSKSSSSSSKSAQQAQQDAINKQIDEYYSAAMGRIGEQEKALKSSEQDYYNIAQTPYTSQVPLVQQAGEQGQAAIVGQREAAGLQEQNALASARRLYDELNTRNRQAFGSGALGSVGQAASEVLGRSAQEGMGNIRNQAGQTIQGLMTAARDLEAKTQAQLQQLDLQKNQALSQAKLWFRERLDAINSMKEQTQQYKASAKLSELQNYRDYVRNLASQSDALKSQIALTAQANGKSISDALNEYSNATGQILGSGNDMLSNFDTSSGNYLTGMSQSNAMTSGGAGVTPMIYGGGYTSSGKKDLNSNFA